MAENKMVCITMLGARRVGKSSTLSAMLNSLDKFQDQTGVSLKPNEATEKKMSKKLTDLQKLYVHKEKEFETQSGQVGEMAVAVPTDAMTDYDFSLSVKGKKKSVCDIRFTDIRGEDIIHNADAVQRKVQDSSIVLVAIDSVALMETDGNGKNWHEDVNYPTQISKLLRKACAENNGTMPQLILFVPLKCEKYYWEADGMARLNARIKEEYAGLLGFLGNYDCFSVAVTPILTLGDIVFSRFDENAPHDQYQPLYKMREVTNPSFSPRFCEQPLCYLIKYIFLLPKFVQKKHNALLSVLKGALTWYLFGVLGLAIFLIRASSKGKMDLKKLSDQIKTEGDGYELIIDRLGIAKTAKQTF